MVVCRPQRGDDMISRHHGEVAVKACLNGGRTRAEHHAVPQSAAELALDAVAARAAGAFAVHVHPRDAFVEFGEVGACVRPGL